MELNPPTDAQGAKPLNQSNSSLPVFNDPPVFETVLGLEFLPLSEWQVPHFGMFWERIKEEFPLFEVKPPLGSSGLGKKAKFGELVLALEVRQTPPIRCWFLEETGTRLIQVQCDRFVHNWRKVSGEEEYPRYERKIRPAFAQEWSKFIAFLSEMDFSPPEIHRSEVTYVNHLVRGQDWESLEDLPRILKFFSGEGLANLKPEAVTLNMTYDLPQEGATLEFSLSPVVRNVDSKEVLQFSITVKGTPASSELNDLLEWFDKGREWVVNSFAEFTTDEMHSLWGRIR